MMLSLREALGRWRSFVPLVRVAFATRGARDRAGATAFAWIGGCVGVGLARRA